jgi:hypothetical protein
VGGFGFAGTKVLHSLLGNSKRSGSSSRSMPLPSPGHASNTGYRRPVNSSTVPKPLAAFQKAAPLEPAVDGYLAVNSQQQRQAGRTPPPPLAAARGAGLLDKPAVLQNGVGGSSTAAAAGGGGGGSSRGAVMKGLGLAQKPKASLGGLLGKPMVL